MKGIYLYAASTILFGLAAYAKSASVYLIISFLARTMQGCGDAVLIIATPVMIVSAFPEKKEEYMGYFVMTLSLGLLFGPVIGSFVYSYLDYAGTFYFFFACCLLSAWLAQSKIPESMNQQAPQSDATNDDQITYSRFFKNKKACVQFFSMTLALVSCTFFYPNLGP